MDNNQTSKLSSKDLSRDNNKGILEKGYKGYVVDRVSKVDILEGGRDK